MKYANFVVTVAGVAALATVAAGFAHAQAGRYPSQYAATLAQPVASQKDVVANDNAWRCSGSTCILTSHPIDPDSVRSCRQLRHQVGALTAYGAPDKSFDSDKLARCNS